MFYLIAVLENKSIIRSPIGSHIIT